jgi:hypothetical protein
MSWNELIVDYDVFLSSFNVKPNGAMSFLVGSGISVQSGIPTGGQLVWEFKREIFCRETRTHRDSFSDLSLQKNQVKLQAYFDSKGEYPKLYAPDKSVIVGSTHRLFNKYPTRYIPRSSGLKKRSNAASWADKENV